MSRSSSRSSAWPPVLIAIVASVLLHVVLWPVGNRVVNLGAERTLPEADSVMEVSLLPEESAAAEEPVPEPSRKVVSPDRVVDERPPEKPAPYVSEFDSRTDKATRAPNRRPTPKSAPKGSDATPPQPVQPDEAGGRKSGGIALPLGGRDSVAREPGKPTPRAAAGTDGEESGSGKAKSLSPRSMTGVPDGMRERWGNAGTLDNLEDLEEGDETILNSRRWKYASFFNRLKNDIAQYWDPVPLLRARDPEGRKNGTKTRRTRLLIILNADGSLHKVTTQESCGVEYLDSEAIRAVRSAAPFPNPPKGMLDAGDGRLHVPFGFIVEMGQGKSRIQRYRK